MKLALLLAIFTAFPLYAQVDLLIEDSRDSGFYLGIDGFLQNSEMEKQILIKGLDTLTHRLYIKSGDIEFSKPVHIRQAGMHKYIIVEDFYGRLKLRYRGMQVSKPAGLVALGLQDEVSWPGKLAAGTALSKVTLADTVTSQLASHKADSVIHGETVPDTAFTPGVAAMAALNLADSAVAMDSLNTMSKTDSLEPGPEQSSEDSSVTAASTNKRSFDILMKALGAQDFEFERLRMCQEYAASHSLQAEQLGQLFSALKYDQSRMQLIHDVADQISDPQNLPDQSRYFEYEITKSQYILFINEE